MTLILFCYKEANILHDHKQTLLLIHKMYQQKSPLFCFLKFLFTVHVSLSKYQYRVYMYGKSVNLNLVPHPRHGITTMLLLVMTGKVVGSRDQVVGSLAQSGRVVNNREKS